MKILVTGATGFIGRALRPALLRAGHHLRATTRSLHRQTGGLPGEEWVEADLLDAASTRRALQGIEVAFYLVHSMGGSRRDFRALERKSAQSFADAAASAGVGRIIYLGGVAPQGAASEHLGSRLEVGEILRRGEVPVLELRASMIIGNGSASWRIVRDLSLRLPAMVLPAWLRSRTRPVAIQDVVEGLVRAVDLPMQGSAWYDLPGPDTLNGRQMLSQLAGLRGRRVPMVEVPLLSPRMSSFWLKLITGADFGLARELVMGLQADLLPRDERFWEAVGYRPQWGFEAAARAALLDERPAAGWRGLAAEVEEALVDRFGPRKV